MAESLTGASQSRVPVVKTSVAQQNDQSTATLASFMSGVRKKR